MVSNGTSNVKYNYRWRIITVVAINLWITILYKGKANISS